MARTDIVIRRTFAAASLLCFVTCPSVAQTVSNGKKYFEDSIAPLPPADSAQPATIAPLTQAAQNKQLDIHFGLATNNIAELNGRIDRGEVISPSEYASRYSVDPKKTKLLTDWLASQGFKSIKTDKLNTFVSATASVKQIEKSLGVGMKNVTINGTTVPSVTPDHPPALPSDVGDPVVSIIGLQPWLEPTKQIVTRTKKSSAAASRKKSAARASNDRSAAATPSPHPRSISEADSPYRVADILKAYNADALVVNGMPVTGQGQTIGILIDTLPDADDVRSFWRENHLVIKPTQLQFINVTKSNKLPKDRLEASIDVEWASGIAPGAKIRVYAAGSLKWTDLEDALRRIINDVDSAGLRILSLSLSTPEGRLPVGIAQTESTLFRALAALGVTTFVSTGDAGSNPDGTNHGRGRGELVQVDYQASDRSVIAVGGTTLKYDRQSSAVTGETGWTDSGGGVSAIPINARPSWQHPYDLIQSSLRMIPDVSSVADDNPGGLLIYKQSDSGCKNSKCVIGGTSWSAPTWAGFAALIADAREKQGKARLGFLGSSLYNSGVQGAFRDIKDGSNGAYHAGEGWDPVTGIGVPNLKALIQSLP